MSDQSPREDRAVAELTEVYRRYSCGLLRRLLRGLPTKQDVMNACGEIAAHVARTQETERSRDVLGSVHASATHVLWQFYAGRGLGEFPLEQSFAVVENIKQPAVGGAPELRTLVSNFPLAEREMAERAATYIADLNRPNAAGGRDFLEWLSASAVHVRLLLELTALADEVTTRHAHPSSRHAHTAPR